MPKLEMNTRDFEVKTVTRKDGSDARIVQLRPAIAFDEDFVQEMESLGVREFTKQTTDEE